MTKQVRTLEAIIAALIAEGMAAELAAKVGPVDERIEKLQAKRARIIEGKPAKQTKQVVIPELGSEVTFSYGRGETLKTLTGVLVGVSNEEGKPTVLAARVGEGFDMQVVKLFPSQLILNDAETAAA